MVRISKVVLVVVLFPYSVTAAEEPDAMSNFLNVMTSLYITSEKCKHLNYTNAESFGDTIKTYLTRYYASPIPYWVLPAVNETTSRQEDCYYKLQEGVTRYQIASASFSGNYPNEPTPPNLPKIQVASNYAQQYAITSPIVTK